MLDFTMQLKNNEEKILHITIDDKKHKTCVSKRRTPVTYALINELIRMYKMFPVVKVASLDDKDKQIKMLTGKLDKLHARYSNLKLAVNSNYGKLK